MNKTNHFNLMFDPKKSMGVISQHYNPALSDAVVTAAQLQANLSAEKRDSDVIFWGKLDHILGNRKNIKPENSFRNKELTDGSKRSDLPELTSIDINKTSKIEVIDCNGQVIEDFNQHKVPIKYRNKGKEENSTLLISENKNLFALSKHAFKHNMITEEQKEKIDFLVDRINPNSRRYLSEVGIVNDVKKPIILFLEQKIFKGGSYYLDIDRAQRLKEFDEKKYVNRSNENSQDIGMYNFNSKEIDVMFLQAGRTDENQLFSVINEYHNCFKRPYSAKEISDNKKGVTDRLFWRNYRNNTSLNISSVIGKDSFTSEYKQHKGRTWENRNVESQSITR